MGRGAWWALVHGVTRVAPFTGALGQPRGVVRGGRREGGSGWVTRVYLWWMHVDIWQNQYNIVKLKNKIKYIFKKKRFRTEKKKQKRVGHN